MGFFAMLGMLSPASRGALLTAAIFLYEFLGVVAGYYSGRLYRTMKGKEWKAAAFLTSTLVLSLVLVSSSTSSSGASTLAEPSLSPPCCRWVPCGSGSPSPWYSWATTLATGSSHMSILSGLTRYPDRCLGSCGTCTPSAALSWQESSPSEHAS